MRGVWGLFLLGLSLAQVGPKAYYERCARLYAQGALEGAQATCELALVSDPNHRPSLKLLVRIHLDRGEPGKAKAYLERLGDDPGTLPLRARVLLQEGRYREVLALGLPAQGEGALLQALALERLGRYEEALGLALKGERDRETRLLLARLYLALGRPQEAWGVLGDTPEEAILKGRALLLLGRLGEAASQMEALLPRLTTSLGLYEEALIALALAYLGQGDWERGWASLVQLGQVENLPRRFLLWAWPWLLLLLAFLVLLSLGESRVEPLQSLEVVENPLPGPGRLLLWGLGSLVLALGVGVFLGRTLYGNLLALLTPGQAEALGPLVHFLLGVFLLLGVLVLWPRARLGEILGPRETSWEGVWVGPILFLLLLAYGALREVLGLSRLEVHPLSLLALALSEPFYRGALPLALQERYRELAYPLAALAFALLFPGPPLFLLLAGGLLLWVRRRLAATWPLALGWVVLALILAFLPPPWVRTLL